MLPEHTRSSLIRWIEVGRNKPPGGFISALLSNNLREVFMRADDFNLPNIHYITQWMFNHMPPGSYGEKGVLKSWEGLSPEGFTDWKRSL